MNCDAEEALEIELHGTCLPSLPTLLVHILQRYLSQLTPHASIASVDEALEEWVHLLELPIEFCLLGARLSRRQTKQGICSSIGRPLNIHEIRN